MSQNGLLKGCRAVCRMVSANASLPMWKASVDTVEEMMKVFSGG